MGKGGGVTHFKFARGAPSRNINKVVDSNGRYNLLRFVISFETSRRENHIYIHNCNEVRAIYFTHPVIKTPLAAWKPDGHGSATITE